jgi:aminoglycoside phosphotransferase family enzyme
MTTRQGSSNIDEKVAFLKRPESYACRPSFVESIETHMAWVFLTDRHAYKLKKPVRYDYLDFSTIEARQLDCYRELQLNRRLAPDVYLEAVPLVQNADSAMQIGGSGTVIDWLVKMRKLPRERMLDRAIEAGTVGEDDIRRVAMLLGDFYRRSAPVEMLPAEYRHRFTAEISKNVRDLTGPNGLPPAAVESVAGLQSAFVTTHMAMLDGRVDAGHIIDAHGDLRPEHVCLQSPPVIIDCLEFNREFRLLDAASELSFLTLECDRLGAPRFVVELLWAIYQQKTGDIVPGELRRFYRSYHALTRAKIAILHLRDVHVRTPDSWKPKAEHYLQLATVAIT